MSAPIKSYLEYVTTKGQKYYYETTTHATSYKFPEDGVVFDPNTGKVIFSPPGVTLVLQDQHDEKGEDDGTQQVMEAQPIPLFTGTKEGPPAVMPPPPPDLSEERDIFVSAESEVREAPVKKDDSDLGYFERLERQKFGTMTSGFMRRRSETIARHAMQEPEAHATVQIKHVRKATMTPAAAKKAKGKLAADVTVARAFVPQDVLALPFACQPTFTKQRVIDALNKYKLEDFAAIQFRKQKKKGLGKTKFIPLPVLMSFQPASLKSPLLLSVPKDRKSAGVKMFKFLLQYTGVKQVKNPMSALVAVIQIIRDNYEFLCDEFYFQLVKQTTSNPSRAILLKTWEMFLIIASLFPSSQECYMWILAHIGRAVIDSDSSVSAIASLTFMRFETRHFLDQSVVTDSKKVLAHIPEEVAHGTACFSCTLYEMMWNQRATYPSLPIPYVLYYIIKQLQDRNANSTNGIFKVLGNKGVTNDILVEVNTKMEAISRGDVNVLANLLKIWLKELPNPIVPIEMNDDFIRAAKQNRFRTFIEKLPQVHKLTLLYIIGFIQDIYSHADENKMEKSELATIFGPCIVNPVRAARDNPEQIQYLTELSVAFISKMIDEADPSQIYPINPLYLAKKPAPSPPSADKHPSQPSVQSNPNPSELLATPEDQEYARRISADLYEKASD